MLEEQIINAIHIYSANISEQQTKYNHLSVRVPCCTSLVKNIIFGQKK